MPATSVFTDGACSGNPGPGGWAWAVEGGRYESGYEEHTTNQRMEIKAVLQAVRELDGQLEVVSDSTYVVNCFRDSWHVGWIKRGWLNSQKKPVANRDLWEPLIELVLERGDVTFRWVKGHGTDKMNDLVDRLAVQAVTEKRGRSGTGRPRSLGPADAPAPRKSVVGAGPRLPDGHLIMVTGLRPPQLGGYDPNPTWDTVRAKLVETLAWRSVEEPDAIVVTGMGLGVEQLAAEAALEAGVPFVAVLPFDGVDGPWSAEVRGRFRSLVERSLMTVVYDDRAPTSKQAAGAALSRRDGWLARQVSSAVVVHDGEDERTEKALRSLVLQLGDEAVMEVLV